MKCPNCKEIYNDEYDFCPHCGTKKPKEKTCPKCKFKSAEYEFCPKCGERLLTKKQLAKKIEEDEERRIEKEKKRERRRIEKERQREKMKYEGESGKEELNEYLNKYKDTVPAIAYFKIKKEIEKGKITSKKQLDNQLKIRSGEANRNKLLEYLEKNTLIGSTYIPEDITSIKREIEYGSIKSISEIEQAKARLVKQRNEQRARAAKRSWKKWEKMQREMRMNAYYSHYDDEEEEVEYEDEERERTIEEIADDYRDNNDYDRWEYHDHGIIFILEGSGMYYGKREVLSDDELRDYDS